MYIERERETLHSLSAMIDEGPEVHNDNDNSKSSSNNNSNSSSNDSIENKSTGWSTGWPVETFDEGPGRTFVLNPADLSQDPPGASAGGRG